MGGWSEVHSRFDRGVGDSARIGRARRSGAGSVVVSEVKAVSSL